MNKIQLRLFAFVFAAFLPPKSSKNNQEEDDDECYYSILGLEKSCKQEEIRKAYKKKSLQYHPDKVAQFTRSSHKTPAEIQADFVKIKEAYEVLSDMKKRNAYDVLGPEGAKLFLAYHDPESSSGVDPNQVMMNLATASYVNKTKLFLLVFLFISMFLIGPILICIKTDSVFNGSGSLLEAKWIFVLIPIWVLSFLFLLLTIISQAWFLILKTMCIIVLEVFLAVKWDGIVSWDYVIVLLPLILHHAFSLVESLVALHQIRMDVARMVTVSYLEEKVLPTLRMDDVDQPVVVDEAVGRRYYNDLTEDEKEYINKLYIIVDQHDDDFYSRPNSEVNEPQSDLDPEVKVLFDVVKSSEFKHASQRQNKARKKIMTLILTRLPFLILLILQLDLNKGWDWNLVFCTIWIEVCFDTLSNCFTCCCVGVNSSDVEVIYEGVDEKDRGDENDDEEMGQTANAVQGKSKDSTNDNMNPPPTSFVDENVEANKEEEEENKFAPVTFSPLLAHDKNENSNNDEDEMDETDKNENINVETEHDEHENLDPELIRQRSEACGTFFNNIISIIFLALFTVKLNGAYDGIDGTASYSSMWIIFPLLFFAGLILLSCGCCIYMRITPDKVESVMSRRSHTKGSGTGNADDESHVSEQNVGNVATDANDCDDLD